MTFELEYFKGRVKARAATIIVMYKCLSYRCSVVMARINSSDRHKVGVRFRFSRSHRGRVLVYVRLRVSAEVNVSVKIIELALR